MGLGKYIGSNDKHTVGLYHLDGDAKDSSENNFHGIENSISYRKRMGSHGFGAGFNFIGWGEIKIGEGDDFKFDSNTPMTIRALVEERNTVGAIVSNRNTNVSDGWAVIKHVLPTPRITMERADDYGYQAEKEYDLYAQNQKREMMHCVCVYDNVNDTMQVFINGVGGDIVDSSAQTGVDNEVFIGAHKINNNIDNNFIDGILDEVAIEQVAWDRRKITRDYAQSIGRLAPRLI